MTLVWERDGYTDPVWPVHVLFVCDFYFFNLFIYFFFCVPQLYLWGSPLLGEIFAYVAVF